MDVLMYAFRPSLTKEYLPEVTLEPISYLGTDFIYPWKMRPDGWNNKKNNYNNNKVAQKMCF